MKLFLLKSLKVISFESIKRNLGNWAGSSIRYKTEFPEKIKMYKLDDLDVNIKENIGMMKIDIECSELNMIEGGIKFIKDHFIKVILFELNCICENSRKDSVKIYEILESFGYTITNKINCKKGEIKDVIAVRN